MLEGSQEIVIRARLFRAPNQAKTARVDQARDLIKALRVTRHDQKDGVG